MGPSRIDSRIPNDEWCRVLSWAESPDLEATGDGELKINLAGGRQG